ncbi:MAG: DUF2325 domain-containing protein [Spirochaetaceae bacterium]|jgi:hypothetical protein|nr:DUF2325 domain-containing protein [Spirochaetaceae bacterium]
MSVVIIGGNDRMVCRYRDICREYNCEAKIYTQPKNNLECLMGNPDLIVLFTNPVSHEMIKIAKKKAASKSIPLVQSHCASCSSLRNVLSVAKSVAKKDGKTERGQGGKRA